MCANCTAEWDGNTFFLVALIFIIICTRFRHDGGVQDVSVRFLLKLFIRSRCLLVDMHYKLQGFHGRRNIEACGSHNRMN